MQRLSFAIETRNHPSMLNNIVTNYALHYALLIYLSIYLALHNLYARLLRRRMQHANNKVGVLEYVRAN